ncbi:class I SAM-dependent methyltransferase [Longibacter salinarum]|nr:class I SAM-dependent methyltransferase [Longibacter salinarum]
MQAPSDHLLRTMAAVPVNSFILDLGCGEGRHTEPLLRLGFPVHGCDPRPDAVERTRGRIKDIVGEEDAENCVQVASLAEMDYPDESFDWVVVYHGEVFGDRPEDVYQLLSEARRMLKPGGWAYVTFPAAAVDIDDQERTAGDGAPASSPAQSAAGSVSIDELEAQQERANLATASAPEIAEEPGAVRVRAIFRRVDPNTPA